MKLTFYGNSFALTEKEIIKIIEMSFKAGETNKIRWRDYKKESKKILNSCFKKTQIQTK